MPPDNDTASLKATHEVPRPTTQEENQAQTAAEDNTLVQENVPSGTTVEVTEDSINLDNVDFDSVVVHEHDTDIEPSHHEPKTHTLDNLNISPKGPKTAHLRTY